MKSITQAQQRILDLLSDGRLHALLYELDNMGYINQHPAITALEGKGLIKKEWGVVVAGGYYTRWQMVMEFKGK